MRSGTVGIQEPTRRIADVDPVLDHRLTVLISGGGIAGGSLACLSSRRGHDVTLVERDQGARSSGNPVDVGAAFDAVDPLDLVPRLREVATTVHRVVCVATTGQPLATMNTRRSENRGDPRAATWLDPSPRDLPVALTDRRRPSDQVRPRAAVLRSSRPDASCVS